MHKKEFPRYWLLLDHGKAVGALCITNKEDQAELVNVMSMANAECKHDLAGKCAEIKPISFKQWRRYH